MWTRIKEQWALLTWVVVFTVAISYAISGYKEEKFWHRWELAAIASTSVYAGLVYVGVFYTKLFKGIKRRFLGRVVGFLVVALFALCFAFVFSWNFWSIKWHLSSLLAAAVCFICVDKTVAHQRSGVLKATRDTYKREMLFSDVPIGIGFALLLFYAILIDSNAVDKIRAFFGGAIALQMLLSSWVCALSFHVNRSTKTKKE